jgi:predicted  nucleic acid-binding Zn-ribbon protein
VKADPTAQIRLLDLQAVDRALDQLAHRRRTLPEIAEIEKATAVLGSLRDDVVRGRTAVEDLDREIRRLETDVEQVRARKTRDQQRMDSGAVTHAKELESLQHEVASLSRRQSELEDTELELMERREEAQAVLDAAVAALDEGQGAIDAAAARRDAAFAEIDAAEATRRAERDPAAAGIPADLLALYEKIRASSGGTGAAMLRARRCEGCRIELSGSDMSALAAAPADEVVRCEECRRILVRTGESGL